MRQSLPLNKRKGRRQGQQGGGDSNSNVSNGATRRSYGSGKNSRYVVPSPSAEDSSAHGSWKISMMSSGHSNKSDTHSNHNNSVSKSAHSVGYDEDEEGCCVLS